MSTVIIIYSIPVRGVDLISALPMCARYRFCISDTSRDAKIGDMHSPVSNTAGETGARPRVASVGEFDPFASGASAPPSGPSVQPPGSFVPQMPSFPGFAGAFPAPQPVDYASLFESFQRAYESGLRTAMAQQVPSVPLPLWGSLKIMSSKIQKRTKWKKKNQKREKMEGWRREKKYRKKNTKRTKKWTPFRFQMPHTA